VSQLGPQRPKPARQISQTCVCYRLLSFLRLRFRHKKIKNREEWPRRKGARARVCSLSPKTFPQSTRTRAPPPADIICVTCHVESVHKVCKFVSSGTLRTRTRAGARCVAALELRWGVGSPPPGLDLQSLLRPPQYAVGLYRTELYSAQASAGVVCPCRVRCWGVGSGVRPSGVVR
jgi:hypothetical protein